MNMVGFLTNMYPQPTAEFYDQSGVKQGGENISFIQGSLIEGICKNAECQVRVVNKLLVYQSKKKRIPCTHWENDVSRGVNFSFVALPLFSSNLLRLWGGKYIKPFYKDLCFVFAYGATNFNLRSLICIKQKNPHAKVGLIVPDIPAYTKTGKGLIKAIKNGITNRITNRLIHKAAGYIDCYYLFSKHMANPMQCGDKYIVMEGIATDCFADITPKRIVSPGDIQIVYGGGLHKRYGAKLLVKAFELLQNERCHLILCGTGDYVDEIIEKAASNPRIHYLGSVPREELLALELGANILVNPRTSEQSFTEYSFPSKNMEYLSSGHPVVAFKLGGIPDDYDRFIHYPCDESAEAFSKKIEEVLEDLDACEERAKEAKEYVLTNKNKMVQSQRMLAALE